MTDLWLRFGKCYWKMLEDLYKEIILDHARYPKYQDPLASYSIEEKAINRSCGDELTLQILLTGQKIEKISVHCSGCSICQASCSMMGESAHQKPISEIQKMISNFKDMFLKGKEDSHRFSGELEQLEALRGVLKFPIRVKCATLGWNALEQALRKLAMAKASGTGTAKEKSSEEGEGSNEHEDGTARQ